MDGPYTVFRSDQRGFRPGRPILVRGVTTDREHEDLSRYRGRDELLAFLMLVAIARPSPQFGDRSEQSEGAGLPLLYHEDVKAIGLSFSCGRNG